MSKPNLLFLYMARETGHEKAAEALMEAVSQMDPRIQCVARDGVSHAYPVIGTVVNRMYLEMLKRAPAIWDYLYDNPEVEAATRDARGFLTLIGSFRTKKFLNDYKPIAVICTQAVPAIAMAAEKRKGRMRVPIVGVVTDFGVHSYWYHPEVDLYLVGHEEVRQSLIRKGVDPERVRVTGIPIRPRFGETFDQVKERKRLRLQPNLPTLLVMGGSHGLGPLDELVTTIRSSPVDFQTLVVCGRNRSMQKKISKIVGGDNRFRVLGYTKDLAELMSASDILISKPGGLTCSEALAMQLPMIVTAPLPGQEERNVRFLLRHRVARLARTPEDLIHTLFDLFRHPREIALMRQRAKLISKPHSAWEGARLIFDLINRRGSFANFLR